MSTKFRKVVVVVTQSVTRHLWSVMGRKKSELIDIIIVEVTQVKGPFDVADNSSSSNEDQVLRWWTVWMSESARSFSRDCLYVVDKLIYTTGHRGYLSRLDMRQTFYAFVRNVWPCAHGRLWHGYNLRSFS